MVDEQVGGLIESLVLPDDWLQAALTRLSLRDEVARVAAERERLQDKLRKLTNAWIENLVDEADYQRRKAQITFDLTSLVVPEADTVAEAGRLVQQLPELWAARPDGTAQAASDDPRCSLRPPYGWPGVRQHQGQGCVRSRVRYHCGQSRCGCFLILSWGFRPCFSHSSGGGLAGCPPRRKGLLFPGSRTYPNTEPRRGTRRRPLGDVKCASVCSHR